MLSFIPAMQVAILMEETAKRTILIIGFAEKIMKNCPEEYYNHIMIGEWNCDYKKIIDFTISEKNNINEWILQKIYDYGYIIIKY